MGRFFFNTIIIINLQRRPDKLKKVLQRIYDLKLEESVDIQVLSAVDGKELSDEWLKDNIRISPLYRDSMRGRGMTYGEIGCALSHMKAWEMVKNFPSITQALIIEDDAVFKPNFLEVIERVKPGIENINYDFMYLSRKKMVEEKEPLVYSDATLTLFTNKNNPSFRIKFYDIFPTSLSTIAFSTGDTAENIMTADATFRFSYYNYERI